MHFLFVCSGQLLILVSLGHEDAIAAGVLHRDVSAGNILIVGERGILIDWDLSKRLKKPGSSADTHHADDGQTESSADTLHADDSQTESSADMFHADDGQTESYADTLHEDDRQACHTRDTVRQPTRTVRINAMQWHY